MCKNVTFSPASFFARIQTRQTRQFFWRVWILAKKLAKNFGEFGDLPSRTKLTKEFGLASLATYSGERNSPASLASWATSSGERNSPNSTKMLASLATFPGERNSPKSLVWRVLCFFVTPWKNTSQMHQKVTTYKNYFSVNKSMFKHHYFYDGLCAQTVQMLFFVRMSSHFCVCFVVFSSFWHIEMYTITNFSMLFLKMRNSMKSFSIWSGSCRDYFLHTKC